MSEFFGGVLAFAGVGLLILAIVALVRPSRRLRMPTRKRALLGVALSFGIILVAGSLLPPPPPPTPAEKAAAAERARQGEADGARQRAEEQKAEEREQESTRAEVVTLWRSVLSAVRPCDEANGRMVDVLQRTTRGSSSVYNAYAAADRGAETCRQSWSRLRDLDAPDGLAREQRSKINESLETCGNAYLARQMSLEQAKVIFDGDFRPSALNDYRVQAEAAQAGVLSCVAGLMSGAVEAGVDLNQMSGQAVEG